ncbi:pirin family protein [Olivibacter domesticus]|uniref:Pirin C-terminal domain-containing protein n=1 Tax=Olivibacter domesticus TaxID=407022 RepID=A0A1H7ZF63_OLID1|nr:pirin-like C-terminal cupin domain-containing protein [Olivibacter domesticus]SEM56159.1 hypothetical protein SAMN05661044_05496 [Olivibacter domesticus]
MHSLRISRLIKSSFIGNQDFSVVKVRASSFDGLMDPLLGFEHFKMSTQAFRPRPYAGMSIITYLFNDSAPYHILDTAGTDLILQPECLSWTQAAKGLVRTASPKPEGLFSHGLQILIDIPGKHKQLNPKAIAHMEAHSIPERVDHGVNMRVLIGHDGDGISPIDSQQAFTFLHITIANGENFVCDLPTGWNATAHLLSGAVRMQTNIGISYLSAGVTVALGESSFIERLSFIAHAQSELLFFSGLPIQEQTCNSGTMFMSSTEDLGRAIADYEEGKMGFITLIEGRWQVIPPV